jgi:hypothetical protein
MPHHHNTIRLIVVTTAGDLDDQFNLNEPIQVLFDRALHEVGGEGSRDQFGLEYDDVSLSDLSRKIGDLAQEFGWVDGTELDLVPKPVVV